MDYLPNNIEDGYEYAVTIVRKDVYDEEYLCSLNLNEKQIKAMMYVKEKGQITNKEYQEICATSKRTASRDLLDLVSSGFFEQIGTTGTGNSLHPKGVIWGHNGAKP
jgi:ATP-dependent DNA helicase RecG